MAGSRLARGGSPRVLERECRCGRVICPLLFLATMVGDWPAVLLIGLAGAAHQAWSANLFTTVSDMFPKKDAGIHHLLAPRLDPLTLPEWAHRSPARELAE